MPRKRYNIVLDPTVVEDVKAQLGDTSFSRFTERALEAALGSGPAPGKAAADPAPPRASARRCELDCGRPVPTSLKVSRCQCGGRLVEG